MKLHKEVFDRLIALGVSIKLNLVQNITSKKIITYLLLKEKK
nr:MAG TPA: UBA-like domain protein [Caudoviricetes sp.]